jgi:ribosome-associated toxin RatA of RatAB toxin-antitoxin module
MEFQHTETFDHPAATVFALLSDLDARPSWLPEITKHEVTPEGPTRIGTTYFEAANYSGYQSEKTSTVTELEQDRLITLATAPDAPQVFVETMLVEPLSPASCAVHFTLQIDGVPKVAAFFMRQSMKKTLPANARRITEVLAGKKIG